MKHLGKIPPEIFSIIGHQGRIFLIRDANFASTEVFNTSYGILWQFSEFFYIKLL